MAAVFVFSLAALAVSVFSFVFFLSYFRRRTGRDRILAEFREEIDFMIRELNEVTVRDETLVEERVKKLRALLEDADRRVEIFERRIAVFDREAGRRGTETAILDELSRPAGHDHTGESEDRAAAYARLGKRFTAPVLAETANSLGNAGNGDAGNGDAGHSDAPAAPPGGDGVYLSPDLFRGAVAHLGNAVTGDAIHRDAAPPEMPVIRRGARQITPKPKPLPVQAVELYRAGLSSSLIASKLGVTVTEVELAIAVAKRTGERDE